MRIGIDLGGTKIEGIVLAPKGKIAKRLRVPTPKKNFASVVGAIVSVVTQLETEANLPAGQTPIGIGTPGVLQPHTGTMKNCNSTVLNGEPLLAELCAQLGERVRLANDADCFALSEASDGAAAGAANVFGVILGTGVGGGVVVNGKPLAGPNALAGEWGHTPLAYLRHPPAKEMDAQTQKLRALMDRLPDRQCYCGRLNCVETFLAGPGLARIATDLFGETRSGAELFAANDAQAEQVQILYCELLAGALAQVMNVLDPEVIVLGGGVSKQSKLYEEVPKRWLKYLFSPDCHTRLVAPMYGDSSGVRGASWLWTA